jgi:hypothetical protein
MRWLSCLAALALGGCVVYERGAVPRPADPPLGANEAARLVSAGVSETVIGELVALRGVEPLDADALAALKKAGASDPLLQKLILAVRTPPPPEEDVVYVEPYPYYFGYGYYGYYPWRGSVGFGFSSRHYYGRPSRGIRVYR